MAVIEITCPHCAARTYVTFVRQTGNGSCPECGNEINNVFQYLQASQSGEGTLLDNFSSGSTSIIPRGSLGDNGDDPYGDAQSRPALGDRTATDAPADLLA